MLYTVPKIKIVFIFPTYNTLIVETNQSDESWVLLIWGVRGNVSSSVVFSVVLIDKAAMASCSEDMAGHAPCRIFMPVKQFHANVQRGIQFSTEYTSVY